jgi:pyrophosphatase PpaX
MASFTTYLFDLDGTLIDSVDLIVASYRHTLRTHRGTVPPDNVWIAGLGTPLRQQLRLFSDDPAEIDAMVATYREHNLRHHDSMVEAFPGTRDALDAIRSRGKQMGIVTSKLQSGLRRALHLTGMEGYFDALVAADDVTNHKPDPEPVLRALELLGANPDETVFVGDSPHDMAAGNAAGVWTAAALWGPFDRHDLAHQSPHYWLTEPTEIATFATA